jgi:chemotaxis protein MotB
MAKKPRPEGKKYNFMDTYGDMMTLLMCFFVLLFAMSTVETSKYNAFAEALSNRFGNTPPANPSWVPPADTSASGDDYSNDEPAGDTQMAPDQTLPADFSQVYEAIEKYIEEHDMAGEVTLEKGANGSVFIRLSQNLLFAGDSSTLNAPASEFLDFLGECFLQVQREIFQVRFLGHTASISGSGTDDWFLSSERSGRVSSYFERTVLFPPYLLQATGYGRHYPIADNSNPASMALNRRVDIVVIGNDPDRLLFALAEASAIYFPGDDTSFFEGAPDELPGAALNDIPALGEPPGGDALGDGES